MRHAKHTRGLTVPRPDRVICLRLNGHLGDVESLVWIAQKTSQGQFQLTTDASAQQAIFYNGSQWGKKNTDFNHSRREQLCCQIWYAKEYQTLWYHFDHRGRSAPPRLKINEIWYMGLL